MGHSCQSRHCLAQLQLLERRDKIALGFLKKTPTILVWDNIDFGEETLSGRGTTHHINGIMLQSSVAEPVSRTNRQPQQKGVSSFKAPPSTPVQQMSVWMSLKRSNVHSQREQWMFWVQTRNLTKCVQTLQTLWKGEVQKTHRLPSEVHTSTWCKYSFCL